MSSGSRKSRRRITPKPVVKRHLKNKVLLRFRGKKLKGPKHRSARRWLKQCAKILENELNTRQGAQ